MTSTAVVEVDPFEAPANDMIKLTDPDKIGHLMLITVNEFKSQLTTVNGPADAVDVDFIDLGVPGKKDAPVRYDGVRVFSKVLVAALRRNVNGRPVLGVLGQGEKKQGKNAPWILLAPTDDQKQIARDYIESLKNDEDPFTS